MSSKVFNYQKYCFFLNQRFWLQFDILNQKTILLIKNSSFLNFFSQLEIISNINSGILIKYFYLFHKLFYSMIPYKTLSILMIGICRFDLLYLEDKISFLEYHIRIYWKNNSFKISILPLLFIEYISYNVSLKNTQYTINFFLQLQYLFKSFISLKIKNILNFDINQYILAIKKISINLENRINLKSFYNIKAGIKLYFYIKKIFGMIPYKEADVKVNYSHYFNFIYNFISSNCTIQDNDKENWLNMNIILRIKYIQNITLSFFEISNIFNSIFYLFYLYSKKKIYFNMFSLLFAERFSEKRTRLSIIGRSMCLLPIEIKLIWNKIFLSCKQKNILDMHRQIFKCKKYKSRLIIFKYNIELYKKIKFVMLYKNLFSFINVIKKKVSRNIKI